MNTFSKHLQEKYNRSILNKSETATETGISQATLDRLRKSGQIQSRKIGGKIFFTVDSVASLIGLA